MFQLLDFLFGAGTITESNLPKANVIAVLKQTGKEIKEQQPNLSFVVMEKSVSSPSPLLSKSSLTSSGITCSLVVNQNSGTWKNWGIMLNDSNREDWDALIKFSVLHEVGHCAGALNPTVMNFKKTTSGKGVLLSNEHESFADVYGILMLSNYYDQQTVLRVLDHIISTRSSSLGYSKAHDSSGALSLLKLELISNQYTEISSEEAVSFAAQLANPNANEANQISSSNPS